MFIWVVQDVLYALITYDFNVSEKLGEL